MARDAAEFLPLKPAWFHILLSLADGACHGYAIRTAVEERSNGQIRLWPATLYGSLRDLVDEGLLNEVSEGVEASDDARRRYYSLTRFGKQVLAAEVQRMQSLVKVARATRALAEG